MEAGMETGMETHVGEPWLESCLPPPPPPPEERNPPDPTTPASYVALKSSCASLPSSMESSDVLSLGEQKEPMPKTLRPHSTPATLMWLEENYEIADGICIPRSTLYMHYVDFCDRNGMQPVNAASFGKIIRQQFPQLTTRRLGTRGQSRYHYYGIAVRETSPYFDATFSKKGLNNVGDLKKEVIKQALPYSQRSKLGTLLPEFPSVKDLRLPTTVPEDKVATFVMMYRTHCQRVLDILIRASFDEVQSFLLHFWQGMPSHILAVLSSNVIVNIVGVCDSILYRAISNVLLPSILQPLPDSLTQVIRTFAKDLESWVSVALEDLPDNLKSVKFDLARRFSQTLRRQTSLNHLCQASRMVLHNADVTTQMLQDWRRIDLDSISRQTLYTMEHAYSCATLDLIINIYREFEALLEEQSPIEAYVDWLETMVERCVVQPSRKRKTSLRRMARQFLLMWSSFGTRVIRDMTLHSAPSFGSFHLLHLMFDDYVLYLVETLHAEERMRELFTNIATDTPPSLPETEESFGDPDGNFNKIKWYSSPPSNVSEVMLSNSTSMVIATASPPTGNDVVSQASPVQQDVQDGSITMRESSIIVEDNVSSVSPSADGNGQMIGDYAAATEPYSSMYAYGNYDGRNGYRHMTNSSGLSRQESRNYSYPNNQYTVMTSHANDGNHVEIASARSTHVRATEASPTNGVDFSASYVPYTTPRRGDYGNYMYEQSGAPLLYSGSNCYYQAYDSSNGHTYYSPRYKLKDDSICKERGDEGDSGTDKNSSSTSGVPMTFSAPSGSTFVRV